jgi:hypothetical protein
MQCSNERVNAACDSPLSVFFFFWCCRNQRKPQEHQRGTRCQNELTLKVDDRGGGSTERFICLAALKREREKSALMFVCVGVCVKRNGRSPTSSSRRSTPCALTPLPAPLLSLSARLFFFSQSGGDASLCFLLPRCGCGHIVSLYGRVVTLRS